MSPTIRCLTPLGSDDGLARSRFLGDIAAWLPYTRQGGRPNTWRVDVHGAGLDRPVLCTVGPPWVDGALVWRQLRWDPVGPLEADVPPRWLPTLRAEIGIAPEADRAVLVLAGSYDVPFEAVGQLLDTAVMNRVARGTVTRFCEDVARRLLARDEAQPEASSPVQTNLVPPRS